MFLTILDVTNGGWGMVVGVIGHGIDGNDIPAKWRDSLKASRWRKQ